MTEPDHNNSFFRHNPPKDLPALRENLGPEAIKETNRHLASQSRIREWYASKDRNALTLFKICGDARGDAVAATGRSDLVVIDSVAAASRRRYVKPLLEHPSISNVVIVVHFDGEVLKATGELEGCGGLKAKVGLNPGDGPFEGIYHYVDDTITTSDALKHAARRAVRVAEITDKPVFAVGMDHVTNIMYPFAQVLGGGAQEDFALPKDVLFEDDEPLAYDVGLPKLSRSQLDPAFDRLLVNNQVAVQDLHTRYPDLTRTQKVQDPALIVVSTEARPVSVRYAEWGERPNTYFGIFLPYGKSAPKQVTDIKIDHVITQLDFPISQANDRTKPSFQRTRTALIETPELELSRYFAGRAFEQPKIQTWVEEGGQMLVAEVRRGQTEKVEVYK